MAKITVHSFAKGNIRTDEMEEAKGKATAEKIKELHCKIIPHTEEIIDDSQLNETGRYHALPKSQA